MAGKRAHLSLDRPSANLPAAADAWVGGGPATSSPNNPAHHTRPTTTAAAAKASAPQPDIPEPMKRLTIDIPESLHREMKIQAAARGTSMVDEVRALLEAHYRPTPAKN